MTTIGEALTSGTRQLREAGIDSARLDCLILLEDIIERGRAHILAHPEQRLTASQAAALDATLAQRRHHVPLAYIRGMAPFYGRSFQVSADVLVPRPETEAMIDILKVIPFDTPSEAAPLRIADIGTGSGCLGITAALEIPGSLVDMYDIDPQALAVAASNAKKLEVAVHVYQENLLERALGRHAHPYDALLTNLPYVPDGFPVNQAAHHEPAHALFAGADGLDAYRRLWQQIGDADIGQKPVHVVTEALLLQHTALARLAASAGYRLVSARNLAQHFSRTPA